ncbi:MAG: hypothetical protein WB615_12605 [Candidatus Tumulicola sp.]
MHTKLAVLTAALSAGALTLLAGCSGGAQSPTSTLPTSSLTQAQTGTSRASVLASGALKLFVRTAGVERPGGAPKPDAYCASRCPYIFVSDAGSTVQVLKTKTYKNIGSITSGVSGSDGLWADKAGNVYVANFLGDNVTEYPSGSGSPSCTYSTGLVDPINVTADDAGNVYVVDFNNFNNPGYIYKYAQCSNTLAKKYAVNKGPEGIAVDKHGDIFVSYHGANSNGAFEEFKRGHANATPLGATVSSPGGLVIDVNGNLIADDQAGFIDVIAPPYSSASPLVSGLSDPFHDSLNKKENLLFNANSGSATVTVYSYPSGKLVTTLGSSNGITAAEGVTYDASF